MGSFKTLLLKKVLERAVWENLFKKKWVEKRVCQIVFKSKLFKKGWKGCAKNVETYCANYETKL